MRRLLELAIIIIGVAILAVGLVPAQTVGTTTATDGDGGDPDDADCDGTSCDDDDVGTGIMEDGINCVQPQQKLPNGHGSLMSWGDCEEEHYDWSDDHFAEWLYNATGAYSLMIGRNDGDDLQAICAWDNIDGIQGWTLHLPTANRIAKYKKFDAPTTSGQVYFEINGTAIPVDFMAGPFTYTAETFNQMLIDRLELAGFVVDEDENFVRVSDDNPFLNGVTDFTMRLTHLTDLKVLALAIEPYNEEDELLCRIPQE